MLIRCTYMLYVSFIYDDCHSKFFISRYVALLWPICSNYIYGHTVAHTFEYFIYTTLVHSYQYPHQPSKFVVGVCMSKLYNVGTTLAQRNIKNTKITNRKFTSILFS